MTVKANLLLRLSAPLWLALSIAPVAAQTADPALAGHYYLSGIRETGSELLLRADGHFEWYLSYGAVDQQADGQWKREGATVLLTANRPDSSAPLFRLDSTAAWTAEAEQELLDWQHDDARGAVMVRCPFLDSDYAATAATPTITMPGEAPAKPLAELAAAADSAMQTALDARSRAASDAQRFVAGQADADSVRLAIGTWNAARWQAQDAARAAGRAQPVLDDMVLPETCRIPRRRQVDRSSPALWQRGLALELRTDRNGAGLRTVIATLHFTDGRDERVESRGGGIALRPGLSATPLTSVTLSAPFAPGKDATLTLPPLREGVIHLLADEAQLVPPAFEVLHLRIEDGELIPEEFGRGRYTRQP